jgi:hypothetical protein
MDLLKITSDSTLSATPASVLVFYVVGIEVFDENFYKWVV